MIGLLAIGNWDSPPKETLADQNCYHAPCPTPTTRPSTEDVAAQLLSSISTTDANLRQIMDEIDTLCNLPTVPSSTTSTVPLPQQPSLPNGNYVSIYVNSTKLHVSFVSFDPGNDDWRKRCHIQRHSVVLEADSTNLADFIAEATVQLAGIQNNGYQYQIGVVLANKHGKSLTQIQIQRSFDKIAAGKFSVKGLTNIAVATLLTGTHDRSGGCHLALSLTDQSASVAYIEGGVGGEHVQVVSADVSKGAMAAIIGEEIMAKINKLWAACSKKKDHPLTTKQIEFLLNGSKEADDESLKISASPSNQQTLNQVQSPNLPPISINQLSIALFDSSANHLAAVIAAYVNRAGTRSVVVAMNTTGLIRVYDGYHQVMMEKLAGLVTPGVQVSVVEAQDVIGKGGALLAANADALITI